MSSSISLSLSDNNSIPSGLIEARKITDAKLNVKSKEQYKLRIRTMIVWMNEHSEVIKYNHFSILMSYLYIRIKDRHIFKTLYDDEKINGDQVLSKQ